MASAAIRRSPISAACLLMAVFALASCGTKGGAVKAEATGGHWRESSITASRIGMLRNALLGLGESVSEYEADAVAETAVLYSRYLADVYGAVRPPLLHNVLVNTGFRDRGLCIHWTEDLLARLRMMDLQSFSLFWGVANRGDVVRVEHSSVVIAARGRAFHEGLVLDPWRNSGELLWVPVGDDRYEWRELSSSGASAP